VPSVFRVAASAMATLTKCAFIYDSVRHVATWKSSASLDDVTHTTWEATFKILKLRRNIRLLYLSHTESPTLNHKNSVLAYFSKERTQPHTKMACLSQPTPTDKPENMMTHIGLLKSLLQKAIRRQWSATAVACAKTYMDINAKSFLRRLLIISCEDVFLDPIATINIVWFYIATLKFKYEMSVWDKNYILSYVSALCKESRYVDPFPNVVEKAGVSEGSMRLQHVQLRMSLELYNATCQFTLEGDARMLHLWQHAFDDPRVVARHPTMEVAVCTTAYETADYVTKKNYSLVGIDFHNFPKVLSHLEMIVRFRCDSEVIPELAELIKSAIWYKRSCINTRKPPEIKQLCRERQRAIDDVWFVIEYPLETFCRNVLYEVKN
jgi:hypothetical protein